MISASTDTAVSSAVRLPMSSPHGAWIRARSASPTPGATQPLLAIGGGLT